MNPSYQHIAMKNYKLFTFTIARVLLSLSIDQLLQVCLGIIRGNARNKTHTHENHFV